MPQLTVNLDKNFLLFIGIAAVFLVVFGTAIAYQNDPGAAAPATMGHTANEIHVNYGGNTQTLLSDAIASLESRVTALENAISPSCGDSVCSSSECSSCPGDCTLAQCCGNGVCNSAVGETYLTCAQDCPSEYKDISWIGGFPLSCGTSCYNCPGGTELRGRLQGVDSLGWGMCVSIGDVAGDGITDFRWVGGYPLNTPPSGYSCPAGYALNARLKGDDDLGWGLCIRKGSSNAVKNIVWVGAYPRGTLDPGFTCPSGYTLYGRLQGVDSLLWGMCYKT